MAQDYYPGGMDEAAPAQAPAPEAPAKPDDEKMEGQTTLIPKSLLGGKDFQPGEEVVLKVVKIHGDEVEVAYASGEDEEAAEPAPDEAGRDESEMAQADSKLAMMAE